MDEQFGTNDPIETPENERGQVADAVEGRREAEEDIRRNRCSLPECRWCV